MNLFALTLFLCTACVINVGRRLANAEMIKLAIKFRRSYTRCCHSLDVILMRTLMTTTIMLQQQQQQQQRCKPRVMVRLRHAIAVKFNRLSRLARGRRSLVTTGLVYFNQPAPGHASTYPLRNNLLSRTLITAPTSKI